jgi:hypothetical protein
VDRRALLDLAVCSIVLRVKFVSPLRFYDTDLSKIHRLNFVIRAVDGPSVSDIAMCSIVLRLKCVLYVFRMNQKRVSSPRLNFDTT